MAQRLLDGDALSWWEAVCDDAAEPRSWEDFLREFNRRYFSAFQQNRKRTEFHHLRQGTRTVTEYEAELRRLAAFVPDLATPSQLRFKFEDGLNLNIRRYMTVTPNFSLPEIVDSALRAEEIVHAEGRQRERREQRRKRPEFSGGQSSKKGRTSGFRGDPSQRQGSQSQGFRAPAPSAST